ncbi:MAG: hypothetical protein K0U84_20300 [Actinomycetia bacterium]|nr:hypothetical protein [Actinomycetes bacterium]
MASPIRRDSTGVRAYSDQLRVLMSRLSADPLDEQASTALISHIINGRSTAAQLMNDLHRRALGISC